MIKDIPCRAALAELIDAIHCSGFNGRFQYLYMPTKPMSGQNRGYAFVGFHESAHAGEFEEKMSGMVVPGRSSSKVLSLEPAHGRRLPLQSTGNQRIVQESSPWGPVVSVWQLSQHAPPQTDKETASYSAADCNDAAMFDPVWVGIGRTSGSKSISEDTLCDQLVPMKVPLPAHMTIQFGATLRF
jgi:hypothetical protein